MHIAERTCRVTEPTTDMEWAVQEKTDEQGWQESRFGGIETRERSCVALNLRAERASLTAYPLHVMMRPHPVAEASN
jgi:hypothetical protein